MIINIKEFLEWIFDKEKILFTYEVNNSNFIEELITQINFKSIDSDVIYELKCPISKKENKNILRIVRKSLFELNSKTIITYNLKDFLNFIPGNSFINNSNIYDIQILESISHENNIDAPKCKDLFNRFKNICKLNKNQIKLYDEILLPSIFTYSKIEKNGIPTKYDIKLYSYYNLNGTISGRLTNNSFNSQKFINPLNISKEDRNIIQAPNDYELITADYNAMEMRVLSFITKDPKLLEIFENEEEDIYKTIGRNIFNISDINNKIRNVIKDLCFLIIYGGTKFGFSKKQNCSLEQADILIKKFFNIFPHVEEWSLKTGIDICNNGYVESYFGRKRVLDIEKNKDTALRQGQNFLIQSTANDIMMSVIQELEDNILDDSSIIIHLHDSVTILSPENKTNGNKNIIYNIMKSPEKIKSFGINNIKLVPVINISKNWR